MSMKGKLAELSIMAAMMGSGTYAQDRNDLTPDDIDTTPKPPVIPKGCKDYWFNKNGGFSTDKMRKDETVFHCIASNDKNAIKKFNNRNS